MKLRLLLPALAVAALATAFTADEAQAFHWFHRHGGGCCEPACCEPEPSCCEPEPACCEPEPTCCEPEPSCCEPEPCCRRRHCHLFGALHRLFHHHRHGCCQPACCEPEPSCCEPEPSCGCN
jgi:hypothetical protein